MTAQAATDQVPAEVELARRIGRGDERAFESLMRQHNRMLYRLARSILRDEAEAEDALQEAYLAAYRNIAAFRGGAKLSTWLARIVINEAYARLRKQKRMGLVVPFPTHERDQPPVEEDAMADVITEPPELAAMRGELRRLLERKIDALPAQFRTVFILRDVEEMSVAEAAECLEVPPATVRTRAFRARALLREALARDIDLATVDAFEFAGGRCDRIVARVLERWRAPAGAAVDESPPKGHDPRPAGIRPDGALARWERPLSREHRMSHGAPAARSWCRSDPQRFAICRCIRRDAPHAGQYDPIIFLRRPT